MIPGTQHDEFVSHRWTGPRPKIRFVDGVWRLVVDSVPPSSSRRAGKKKPRSVREKRAWEKAEEAEKAAGEAEAPETPPTAEGGPGAGED